MSSILSCQIWIKNGTEDSQESVLTESEGKLLNQETEVVVAYSDSLHCLIRFNNRPI